MGTPTTDIGPGIGAFVAFFLLAVLLWFLMRNMNARMRRMAYAERDRVARVDAEILEAEAEAHAKEAAERDETSAQTAADGPTTSGATLPIAHPTPTPLPTPAEQARQEPRAPSA